MKSSTKKIFAIDFFSSIGGVSCGFKQAGINILGGIDIDINCKKTYEENINAPFLNADVSNLKKEELKKIFGIEQNQDDLIFVGCSPCQYYSNIKTDKTKSCKTRLLLEDFQEFVEYYKPGYIFLENVPGLDKNPDSPLGIFKSYLKLNDYFFDEGVLNAKYYGVPQNRRRYVLLASRVKKIELPKPDKLNIRSVRDAIGDTQVFYKINAGFQDKTTFLHSSAKLKDINLARIKNTPLNGGDRRSWKNDERLQLDCYRNHEGHYDVYGRMFWDKPSPAITTRFISYSNGRYGHPEQDRAISLREGATLQSFPLNYKFFSDSQGVIARMIGNAVPPELAKRIGESIVN
jgi:DNA (cytosine-5)-methyltransferase 1